MYRKLNLDRDKIDQCRKLAHKTCAPALRYVKHHSSTSVECATLWLLGVHGERRGVSLAHRFVEALGRDRLRFGASLWLGRAMKACGEAPHIAAEKLLSRKLDLDTLASIPLADAAARLREPMAAVEKRLAETQRKLRERAVTRSEWGKPLKRAMLLVKKLSQAQNEVAKLAHDGADIVSLATASSHGNVVFSEVLREMQRVREKLVQASNDRQVRLEIDWRGAWMPEAAAVAVEAPSDVVRLDPLAAALVEGQSLKRSLIDFQFSAALLAQAGVSILSRDDELIAQGDAYRYGYFGLVSSLLQEELALRAHFPGEHHSMSHAYAMETTRDAGFLWELAQAQVFREVYPRSQLHYRYAIPNAERDGAFPWPIIAYALAAQISEQNILTFCGPPDRADARLFAAMEALFLQTRAVGDELLVNANGKISRRAHTIVENALKALKKMSEKGLLVAAEAGWLWNKPLGEKEGRGLEGVFQKERGYHNPLWNRLLHSEQDEEG